MFVCIVHQYLSSLYNLFLLCRPNNLIQLFLSKLTYKEKPFFFLLYVDPCKRSYCLNLQLNTKTITKSKLFFFIEVQIFDHLHETQHKLYTGYGKRL